MLPEMATTVYFLWCYIYINTKYDRFDIGSLCVPFMKTIKIVNKIWIPDNILYLTHSAPWSWPRKALFCRRSVFAPRYTALTTVHVTYLSRVSTVTWEHTVRGIAICTGWKTIQGQHSYMGTHNAGNCRMYKLEDNAGSAQVHGNTQRMELPYVQAGRQYRVSTVTWEHTVRGTAVCTSWKTVQGQHSYMWEHTVKGTAIRTGWKTIQGQRSYMGTHNAGNCCMYKLEDNTGSTQLHGNTQCGE